MYTLRNLVGQKVWSFILFFILFSFERLKTPKIEQGTCVSTGSECIFHVFNPYSQAILRTSLYIFAHIH